MRSPVHGSLPVTGVVPAENSRIPALEALRVGAMFLVIALHAALSYVVYPVPDLLWGARDARTDFRLDLGFWWAVGVALPIFFFLSGMVAARLYDTRGPWGYFQDRLRRIALPTLAFSLILLPITLWIWAYGWFLNLRIGPKQFLVLKFNDPEIKANMVGPGHLWFLYYLLTFLVVYGVCRRLLSGPRATAMVARGRVWIDRGLGTPARVIWCIIPTTLILWWQHERIGLDSVMSMQNRVIPDPIRLLHHGWFFLIGAWSYRWVARDGLTRVRAGAVPLLLLTIPIFVIRAKLLAVDLAPGVELSLTQSAISAVCGAALGWCTLWGVLGVSAIFPNTEHRIITRLGQASYWVYLIHFPLIGLIQADLLFWDIPAIGKTAITLVLTLTVSLAAYELAVKETWIGRFLNGGKKPASAVPAAVPVPVPVPIPVANVGNPASVLDPGAVSGGIENAAQDAGDKRVGIFCGAGVPPARS